MMEEPTKLPPLRRMDGRPSKHSRRVVPPKPTCAHCSRCGYLSPAGSQLCTRCGTALGVKSHTRDR